MRNRCIQYIWIVLIVLIISCNSSDLDSNGNPKDFKIGVWVSQENTNEKFTKIEPLRSYLERELNTHVHFYPVDGYAPIIEALKSRKIHIATLSPYSYLIARKKANVSTLFCLGNCKNKLEGDYRSVIITLKTSGIKTIDEIKKNSHRLILAYVDPGSATGRVMPNIYFLQHGINPDKDFKQVVFTTDHLLSVLTLHSGRVDIACVQLPVLKKITKFKKGVSFSDFNLIWVSDPLPPVSNYCIRNDININFRNKLLNAYLNIKKDSAAWNCIMHGQDSMYYDKLSFDSMCYMPTNEKMFDDFEKKISFIPDLQIK